MKITNFIWRRMDLSCKQDVVDAWNVLSKAYEMPYNDMRKLIPFSLNNEIDKRIFLIFIKGKQEPIGIAGGYVWSHIIEFNVGAILKEYRSASTLNLIEKIFRKEFDMINNPSCALCRNNGIHKMLNSILTPLAFIINGCLLYKTFHPEPFYFYASFKKDNTYYLPKFYFNSFIKYVNEAGLFSMKISNVKTPMYSSKIRIILKAFYSKSLLIIDRIGNDIFEIIAKFSNSSGLVIAFSMQDPFIDYGVHLSKIYGLVACGVMCFSTLEKGTILPRFCLQSFDKNDISSFFQINTYDYKYSYINKIITNDLNNKYNHWS